MQEGMGGGLFGGGGGTDQLDARIGNLGTPRARTRGSKKTADAQRAAPPDSRERTSSPVGGLAIDGKVTVGGRGETADLAKNPKHAASAVCGARGKRRAVTLRSHL